MSRIRTLRWSWSRGFVLAALALLWAPTAVAQGWRHVVNLDGTRGSAIGGGSGNTLYAGLGSGHVFRSDDNGVTWNVVTNGLVDGAGRMLLPKAFLTTPTGRVIRAGDNASWDNKAGSPIFYSDNRGGRWTEVPLPFGSPTRNPGGIGVSDIVQHQGAIYFADLLSEGVWKSADNGLSWTAVGEQLPTAPFIGFAKTYFAIASAGNALLTIQASRGVFRSTDGGATWNQAVNGIPGVPDSPLVGGRTWNGADVVAAPDGTAFAIVDSRLYRSRDGGASWSESGAGILTSPNPFVPSVIQPSARKVELMGDRVFVSTSDGNPRFFEGTALGESWSELPRIVDNADNGSILAQSFYAYQGALYFAGSKGVHRLDLATTVRTNIVPLVTVRTPSPLVANVGQTLRIAATVVGTAPFQFEWNLAGAPLPGQSGAELNLSVTATTPSGPLVLVVRNAAGSVTNQLGNLGVAPEGPGFPDYAFLPQRPGATVSTLAFGPDGSVYYGGGFTSQTDQYTGVRKAFPDGTIDASFVTGALIGTGSGPGLSSGIPTTLLPLGDGSVLVGATGTGDNQRYYRRLLANGSIDPNWPWPQEVAGGPRKIVRLADGKFLVAGGSAGGIQRLLPDGTFDASFRGPASIGRFQSNYIRDFVILPDGRILVCGRFDAIDNTRRVGIARLLPNGTLDRSWTPPDLSTGSSINAMVVLPDGRILVGGAFETIGGQPIRQLARLNADGTLDASFANLMPVTFPAGFINVLAAQPDGKVWVGGSFLGVAGRNSLFRLKTDGTVDTDFPDVGLAVGGARPVVEMLHLGDDGRLWIGSSAFEARGHPVGALFRIFTDLDGPSVAYAGPDQTPNLGASITLRGAVTGPYLDVQWRFNGTAIPGATSLELPLPNVALATSGRYELVARSAAGTSISRPAMVRVRGPVVIDRQPEPVVGLLSNRVSFAVGAFGQLPLNYQWFRDGAALTAGTNASLVLTNLPFTAAGEYSVRVSGADGSSAQSDPAFLTVIPVPGTTNALFRLGLFPTTTFTVFKDIAFQPDGRVLVLGNFSTTTNRVPAGLARLLPDGSVDATFQFDATGFSEFIALERLADGKLVVLLRANNGYLVRRLLEDGSRDASFPDVPVQGGADLVLAADGGILILTSQGLSRLQPDGTPDAAFDQRARLNGQAISASVDPAGRIYVAGLFSPQASPTPTNIVRLLPDGTRDVTFLVTNRFSSQWTVTALRDGALVGDLSGFYRFDETGRQDTGYAWNTRLAVWDLDAAGQLAGALATTSGEAVLLRPDGTFASPLGNLRIPASFSSFSFLRFAPDGAIWVAFGGDGTPSSPATKLYKLHGSVSSLSLVTAPVSQTVNAGTTVTFTSAAIGTSRVEYQWLRNGVELPGETNATLVLPNVQPARNGDYTVVARNRSGSVTSRPATLLVLAAPEILAQSGGGDITVGDTLLLSVSARGIAPLAYQWRRNGTAIPGANSASYTNRAVALDASGTYDVVISNTAGTATGAPITVAVRVQPGALLSSFPDLTGSGAMEINVLPNGNILFDATAYTRFGEFVFRLSQPDGSSTILRDRIAVDAARQRIYAGPTRRVRAYGLDGTLVANYAGPNANVRMVRVEAAGTVLQSIEGVTPPLQRLDPTGALASGFTAALNPNLDARPLPDGSILVLNWTQGVAGGRQIFLSSLNRLRSDGTLDPAFLRSTNVFPGGGQATRLAVDRLGRILVLGGTGVSNTNRIVRFLPDGTPDTSFAPPVINGEVSALVEQLNGRLVIVGSFNTVDGQPRAAIARLLPDGAHDLGFNPGAGLTRTAGTLGMFDVDLLPGGEIVVTGVFDKADGRPRNGTALFSGDLVELYFTREPADAELVPGATLELAVEGTGTTAVSYQWFKDGQPLPGQTTPRLALGPANATTQGNYHVVIRNATGELASRTARITVMAPPVIAVPPTSLVVSNAAPATFAVQATGSRLSYQWRFNEAPLAGATNATLVVSNAVAANAGRYTVAVSNPAGSVVSPAALLRVRPAPAGPSGIPLDGILGEVLFETGFNERSNRFPTVVRGNPTRVEGVLGGQAGRFNAGTDWLQLSQTTSRLGGFTYAASFWIWPEAAGSICVYSLNLNVGGFTREHALYLGSTDSAGQSPTVVLATRGFTSTQSFDPRASGPRLVGKWTHVVVVYAGNSPGLAQNFAVYIDGTRIALEGSSNNAGSSGSGNGLGTYGPAAFFRLDDFRLHGRALTADDIRRLRDPGPATPAPVITRQPAPGSGPAGSTFTFSVEATGTDLFYEWYRGDVLLPEADGPQLVLRNLAAADAGSYRVVVSNPSGAVSSTAAALAVGTASNPLATWAAAAGLAGADALPGADPDDDGANNLAEFIYGTSPRDAASRPVFEFSARNVGGVDYPALAFRRRQQPGTATFSAGTAPSPLFADERPAETVSVTPTGDGFELVVLRSTQPLSAQRAQFFRLVLGLNP